VNHTYCGACCLILFAMAEFLREIFFVLDIKGNCSCCVNGFQCLLHPFWRNTIGGFLIHLALGGLYLWGNITNSVTSHLRYYQPDVTYDDTDIVYGTSLGVIGIAMVMGGLMEKYIGAPKVALLGGSLVALSCFLSAIANSLTALILTQGVLFGLGFGIAFAAPISCAVRWSPSDKGISTGMISSGLGCGAFIFGFLANAVVNPDAVGVEDSGEDEGYFLPDGDVANRVPTMFIFMGVAYTGLVAMGYMLLLDKYMDEPVYIDLAGVDIGKHAPANSRADVEYADDIDVSGAGANGTGYESAATHDDDVEMLFGMSALDIDQSNSGNSSHGIDDSCHTVADHSIGDSLKPDDYRSHIGLDRLYKEPLAWHVAMSFALTAATGMYVAGTFKTFGQTFISNESYLIAIASASSLCNMCGRLFWGFLADKYGPVNALMALSFIFSLLLVSYPFTAALGLYWYAAWTCLIFLCEGGNFTLYMSIVVFLFGPKRASTNYGSIFFIFSILNVGNVTLLSLLRLDYSSDCLYLGTMTFIGFISVVILKRKIFGQIFSRRT
jgi:MFS family permease